MMTEEVDGESLVDDDENVVVVVDFEKEILVEEET